MTSGSLPGKKMDIVCSGQMEEDFKKLDDLGKLKIIQCGWNTGTNRGEAKHKTIMMDRDGSRSGSTAKLRNLNFIMEALWRRWITALGNV